MSDNHVNLTSPPSTSQPPPQGSKEVKVPRPPNSWIIYRSEKLKELGQPKAGQPKVSQADISKTISLMWRNESDEGKKVYERKAEYAKAEHARMYPDYRFAPVSKKEKARLRKEGQDAKRRTKEIEKEAKRLTKMSYFPVLDSAYKSEHASMPGIPIPDLMSYSPPISCANTPEAIHVDLPSPVDEPSPHSVANDEPLPGTSHKGKEPQLPPRTQTALVNALAHELEVASALPTTNGDREVRPALDDTPSNPGGVITEFSDPTNIFGWDASFERALDTHDGFGKLDDSSISSLPRGPCGLESFPGQDTFSAFNFGASELQSAFSLSDETTMEDRDKFSPLRLDNPQALLSHAPDRVHGEHHSYGQRQRERSQAENNTHAPLPAASGEEHFDANLFSDFLTDETQQEEATSSGPSESFKLNHVPSLTSLDFFPSTSLFRQESLSFVSSSSASHGPSPHIGPAPMAKRRRFTPDGNHRAMSADTHENGGIFERTDLNRFAPPLLRTGSEKLTHLLGKQLSTLGSFSSNSSHVNRSAGDKYPSPVSGPPFDLPPAQSSRSRKRRP